MFLINYNNHKKGVALVSLRKKLTLFPLKGNENEKKIMFRVVPHFKWLRSF